eukprot:3212239-Pyramimonas_sp.AAC.1
MGTHGQTKNKLKKLVHAKDTVLAELKVKFSNRISPRQHARAVLYTENNQKEGSKCRGPPLGGRARCCPQDLLRLLGERFERLPRRFGLGISSLAWGVIVPHHDGMVALVMAFLSYGH